MSSRPTNSIKALKVALVHLHNLDLSLSEVRLLKTVLFKYTVSRLQNDLYCVQWDIKL